MIATMKRSQRQSTSHWSTLSITVIDCSARPKKAELEKAKSKKEKYAYYYISMVYLVMFVVTDPSRR